MAFEQQIIYLLPRSPVPEAVFSDVSRRALGGVNRLGSSRGSDSALIRDCAVRACGIGGWAIGRHQSKEYTTRGCKFSVRRTSLDSRRKSRNNRTVSTSESTSKRTGYSSYSKRKRIIKSGTVAAPCCHANNKNSSGTSDSLTYGRVAAARWADCECFNP